MANYAYITMKKASWRLPQKERVAAFLPVLTMSVQIVLGDRWRVDLADFEDGGPTWISSIPGTGFEDPREASKRMLAPRQDVGFAVALQKGCIAFRHGPNMFENWAQGCVEEQLADHFGIGVHFDATDETLPPHTREYRRGKTFREYLERNLKTPMKEGERLWVDRFKDLTPEGFW